MKPLLALRLTFTTVFVAEPAATISASIFKDRNDKVASALAESFFNSHR